MVEKKKSESVVKKDDSSSFLLNLTTKIVDNLQICIQNIHVRYEDTLFFKKPICMGITLQKLSIQTTNEEWQETFIDRTLTKNKDKPI